MTNNFFNQKGFIKCILIISLLLSSFTDIVNCEVLLNKTITQENRVLMNVD